MKILKNHFFIAVISLVVMFLLLFIPKTIYKQSELKSVPLGYPYSYITQEPGNDLTPPFEYRILMPTEHITHIDWKNFLISFLIIFLSIEIIMFSAKKISYQ